MSFYLLIHTLNIVLILIVTLTNKKSYLLLIIITIRLDNTY